MLTDERIRNSWISSERDDVAWGRQSFASMNLMSKAHFAISHDSKMRNNAVLGPVWRVTYPSHFGRDVLCCDIFVPSVGESSPATRIRLTNVHLDSLPMNPSHRPGQIEHLYFFFHRRIPELNTRDLKIEPVSSHCLIEILGLPEDRRRGGVRSPITTASLVLNGGGQRSFC